MRAALPPRRSQAVVGLNRQPGGLCRQQNGDETHTAAAAAATDISSGRDVRKLTWHFWRRKRFSVYSYKDRQTWPRVDRRWQAGFSEGVDEATTFARFSSCSGLAGRRDEQDGCLERKHKRQDREPRGPSNRNYIFLYILPIDGLKKRPRASHNVDTCKKNRLGCGTTEISADALTMNLNLAPAERCPLEI